MTTTVATLEAHTNEVWDIQWSHDGAFLASASSDKSAIIWRKAERSSHTAATSMQDWSVHLVLNDDIFAVGRLAWSPDDKVLLTSSEHLSKMWDTETGSCIRILEEHEETVTSICWLPDGTGFVTGSLDRKVIVWDKDGRVRDVWDRTPIRIIDFAITPDETRLVAVGLEYKVPAARPPDGGSLPRQLIVYNLATKEIESSTYMEADLTSVQISPDSQFALINQSPNEIRVWDLNEKRFRHCYKGQKQGRYIIRSCFGGVGANLVVSGSEDGNVYIWDRQSEALLEVLSGHGNGCVNSVSWNPVNDHMFASCSDDHTIRIWDMQSLIVGQTVDPQVM